MRKAVASSADWRWREAASTSTMRPPTGMRPVRWMMRQPPSAQRLSASAAMRAIARSVMAG
jgi:hypothetical protein